MLTYSCQFNNNGFKWLIEIPAIPAPGVIGHWFEGEIYAPDNAAILARLPIRLRKAFLRAANWRQTEAYSGRSVPLKMDLESLKGKPLGTLFCTPNWVAR